MRNIGRIKDTKGAVAPLVAIMLIVIVICVALVVDLGHVHNVKVQMQRAVDAAALAGAQQLSGAAGAGAKARAVAVAAGQVNMVDQEQVTINPDAIVNPNFKGEAILAVQPITWDPNIIDPDTGDTLSTSDRITPLTNAALYDTANALWVTAQRNVDHVFFFFVDATPVTADAIAVNIHEEPVLPLALVSCIPTGGTELGVTSPGKTICDIATFKFGSDPEDTAGWTSLTFDPVNTPNVKQFLDPGGAELFNEIVKGENGETGLDGQPVDNGPFPLPDPKDKKALVGCTGNVGTSIVCGLGGEFPDSPPSITDPLKDYDPLPRWYSLDLDEDGIVGGVDANKNGVLEPSEITEPMDDSPFWRVWSQDGKLLGDQAQLANLYNNNDTDKRWTDRLITLEKGVYVPHYEEAVRAAGYPPVYVVNGDVVKLMDEVLEMIVPKEQNTFKSSYRAQNAPFDEEGEATSGGRGETVLLTMPIIFAGSCENWKAIGHSGDHPLYYVGLANLLLTRAYKNPADYDCGEKSVETDTSACSPFNPDPPLSGNQYLRTGLTNNVKPAALEGLLIKPGGEEEKAGLTKIYLVE